MISLPPPPLLLVSKIYKKIYKKTPPSRFQKPPSNPI